MDDHRWRLLLPWLVWREVETWFLKIFTFSGWCCKISRLIVDVPTHLHLSTLKPEHLTPLKDRQFWTMAFGKLPWNLYPASFPLGLTAGIDIIFCASSPAACCVNCALNPKWLYPLLAEYVQLSVVVYHLVSYLFAPHAKSRLLHFEPTLKIHPQGGILYTTFLESWSTSSCIRPFKM